MVALSTFAFHLCIPTYALSYGGLTKATAHKGARLFGLFMVTPFEGCFFMFDFEKFRVYQVAESYYKDMDDLIESIKINVNLKDQLMRASTSIVLNIADCVHHSFF